VAVLTLLAAGIAGHSALAHRKAVKAAPEARVEQPRDLFGRAETTHPPARNFAKWTDTLARYERERRLETRYCRQGDCSLVRWRDFLHTLRRASPMAQLRAVNAYINRVPYRADMENYGVEDYWATPHQFFAKGGDCEDYAIAKYLSLRALGWPATRLRIAVINDRARDVVHSVLVAYREGHAYVLDIEFTRVTDQRLIDRYSPIFAISENGWWSYRQDEPDGDGRNAAQRAAPDRDRKVERAAARHGVTGMPVSGRPVSGEPVSGGHERAAQPRQHQAAASETETDDNDVAPVLPPGERVEEVFLPGAQ
jgi:predicted transglutaminase-like cysteine proteinase